MPTQKLNPAAASTFGAVNLTDAESFSYDEVSSEVVLGTDGRKFVGGTFVDDVHYRVTVTTANTRVLPQGAGTCATLVLRAADRSCGDGAGAGLTYTFLGATFTGSNATVGHGGTAQRTLTFLVGGAPSEGTLIDPLTVS